jgi:hypothetical protein
MTSGRIESAIRSANHALIDHDLILQPSALSKTENNAVVAKKFLRSEIGLIGL